MFLKADRGLQEYQDDFKEIVLKRKSRWTLDTAVQTPSASLATAHVFRKTKITKCTRALIPRADDSRIKRVVSVLSTELGARMSQAVV